MSGYPEYYTIVYRDDQRVMILEENPEKRLAPPKRGRALQNSKSSRLNKELSPRERNVNLSNNLRLPQTELGSSAFWFPKVKE